MHLKSHDGITNLLSRLPPSAPLCHASLACAYGAHLITAGYCGQSPHDYPLPGLWQHGWISDRRSIHPALIIGGLGSYDAVKTTEQFWVAREDQAIFLKNQGYAKVTAIGLPIVYSPEKQIERITNTLLVMPVHSLDTTAHDWHFEQYVDYIDSIRDNFSDVVICVHPYCKAKNYWYPQFTKRGYRTIDGAFGSDIHSLQRLQFLLRSFEFVTTNGYGSHLVYAALLGARVSIAGPYAVFRAADYLNTPLYRSVPEILEPTIDAVSEKMVRNDYPFLFAEPHNAVHSISWGQKETGYGCRVSPGRMRQLFSWNYRTFRRATGYTVRKARHFLGRASD